MGEGQSSSVPCPSRMTKISSSAVVPDHVRAREVRVPRDDALAEREHVEAVVAGAKRVLLRDSVDDAVTRADLVRLAVLPRQSGPAQHEEDLFRVKLAMDRCRPATRVDLHAVHADTLRARSLTEVGPGSAHVSLFEPL
jgi:hypothetical protein